jgi:TRAP-type C4-dicarboxylate transport system permease small subunit
MRAVSLTAAALDAVDRAACAVVVAIMAGMVLVVSTQVLLRYGFNASLDWADDVGRLLFVWSIFLGIPIGIKEGIHIGISLLVTRMPGALQRFLVRLMALLCVVMMAIIAFEAVRVCVDQWGEMLPTVNASVALFMVPVAIGSAHSALHLLRLVITGTAMHGSEAIE